MSKVAFRAISVAVALIGLLLLFQGTAWAERAAGEVIRAHGGSMDTATYLVMLESFAASYRTMGGVLLGVGAYLGLRPSS